MEHGPAQLTQPAVVVKNEMTQSDPPQMSEAKWPYSVLDGQFTRSQGNVSGAQRHSLEKKLFSWKEKRFARRSRTLTSSPEQIGTHLFDSIRI
jgi:hypothetical protein